MIWLRSLLFVALFYLWSATLFVVMIPGLLAPRRAFPPAMKLWGRVINAMLPICGVRVEFRGLEHLPSGAALIAAKHQCMFDTMGPLSVLTDACYVMKKELTRIPVYGWLTTRAGMITIDREGQSTALRHLLAEGKVRIAEGRQLVIFPEGHRVAPGESGEYQPGVAGLYRALGLPCTLMATNSGRHWPAHGFLRRPGTIVYEFLPPIPPGLSREAFMSELKTRLETASMALLDQ